MHFLPASRILAVSQYWVSAIPGWLRCLLPLSPLFPSLRSKSAHMTTTTMAPQEDLVDLSLFAESPTSDWRFTALDPPSYHSDLGFAASSSFPPFRPDLQSQRHTGSNLPIEFYGPSYRQEGFDVPQQRYSINERRYRDVHPQRAGQPLPRSYTLKPLPPLPPRKLCKSRTSNSSRDVQSRCILNRLKKTRSEDLMNTRRGSLQQRRNLQSTPQLTLTVSGTDGRARRPGHEMVWLSEEQMWLVMDQEERDVNFSPPQRSAPPLRFQPSPSLYDSPETPPPLTPDLAQTRNPFINDEGLSPIQSQFRSLIIDEERRSPLFQEATSTIPDIDTTIEEIMNQGVDADWPLYDPAMYESPQEDFISPETTHRQYTLVDEPISPESPHTPESSFDDVEREWNSAVSVASASLYGDSRPLHSRDTSDQSYHSAVTHAEEFARDEDPVDFYLGNSSIWSGIAKSISSRESIATSTRSWAPSPASPLSHEPSLATYTSHRLPASR